MGTPRRTLLLAGLIVAVASGCGGRQKTSPMVPEEARSQPSANASTVSSEDISRRPQESVEGLLAGKVAGVVVGRNAEGVLTVRIRGATSFMGSEEPLYILDGVTFMPGANGALAGINPGDIESIRALKDAADLAYYGSRGGNGVIVIKTKQGKKKP
jgi:TonB-dependent SusC/RagA subfamily outer membrane receptor